MVNGFDNRFIGGGHANTPRGPCLERSTTELDGIPSANGTLSIPTCLSATAGDTQVVLSWSLAGGATSYNVKSSTNNGGPYITIASPTTSSYTNTGLVNGIPYYYVVSAVKLWVKAPIPIQVSATPAVSPANLALNKPVTVSSIESGYPGSQCGGRQYRDTLVFRLQ